MISYVHFVETRGRLLRIFIFSFLTRLHQAVKELTSTFPLTQVGPGRLRFSFNKKTTTTTTTKSLKNERHDQYSQHLDASGLLRSRFASRMLQAPRARHLLRYPLLR